MAKMLPSRNSQCLCTIPSGAEAASSFFYSERIAELSERRSKSDDKLGFDDESTTRYWTAVCTASANSGDSDEEVPTDEAVVCEATANSSDVDSDEEMPNDDNQSKFDVKSSTSYWTAVCASTANPGDIVANSGDSDEEVSNEEAFEKLKEDPFFSRRPFELEVGAKIAEGGQAEIFEALRVNKYARNKYYTEDKKARLVVKVFKEGFPLDHLKSFWPRGLASVAFPLRYFGSTDGQYHLCWAMGAQLLDNRRFAYIFDRYWGDLRTRIDEHLLGRNGCPPFPSGTTWWILRQIAQGMHGLHKLGFLHNDLKAANVLMKDNKPEEPYNDGIVIADFESSVGIKGTGFWRAPELLLAALKSRNFQQETFTQHTTQKTDVYSFAMTCYEVITGRMPFEGHNMNDHDIVLRGERPMLPGAPYSMYNELIGKCWHQDPHQRPSFGEIVEMLERRVHMTSQCRKPNYYG